MAQKKLNLKKEVILDKIIQTSEFPKIYHFPFSPGVSREDKIKYDYWDFIKDKEFILTEKLDGLNFCLDRNGVYPRSSITPAYAPWTSYLKSIWATLKNDFADLKIFGENMYAIHSIEYSQLNSYFYVFAILERDKWLGWEETKKYSDNFGFSLVPIIEEELVPGKMGRKNFEEKITYHGMGKSLLGGEREGVVLRPLDSINASDFCNFFLKWVRKDHVKDGEAHWTKKWKKARLV